MKKVILIFSTLIFLLAAVIIAAPFIFQDRLNEFVIEEINKNPDVTVDYKNPKVKLFKHFPDITIYIEDLKISPKSKKTSLFHADEVLFSFDLFSVLSGKSTDISKIGLLNPVTSYIIKEDGSSNWDFLLTNSKSDDAGVSFSIDEYYIANASISYKDEVNKVALDIKKLDHSGSGNFNSEVFDLQSNTSANIQKLSIDNEDYFSNVELKLESILNIDLKEDLYTLKENVLQLNSLELNLDGDIKNTETVTSDITFNTNNNSINGLLSLLPVIKQNMGDLKTEGNLQMDGFIKGVFADGVYPDFEINSRIEKGNVSFKEMTHKIEGVNLVALISKMGGDLDNVKVNIKKFNALADGKSIEGSLMLSKILSDPYIDLAVKGKLFLEDLMPYVTDDALESMSGLIDLDVELKAAKSQLLESSGTLQSKGKIAVENASFSTTAFPEVLKVNEAKFEILNRQLKVSKFQSKMGESDVAIVGNINRIFNYLLSDGKLIGDLTMNSRFFNLNPWLEPNESENAEIYAIPENLELSVFATITKVLYEEIDMKDISGQFQIREGKLIYQKVKADALGGKILVDGAYLTKNGKASVDMTYDVSALDIAKTAENLGLVDGYFPVAKYLEGKVSSKMELQSDFTNEMLFDLSTVSGNGNIKIPFASIQSMPLMEKLSSVSGLKTSNWKIENAWTVVKIKNGKMAVEPFTVKAGGYDMLVSGSNGLDKSIDYLIKLDVPSDKLGTASTTVQNWIKKNPLPNNSQLIPKVVRFTFGVSGSFMDPKVALKSVKNGEDNSIKEEAKQIIEETVDKEIEKAKTQVEKVIEENKSKIEKEVEEKKEEVKQKVDKEVEETKDKAKEKAKEILKIP
ncbi:MAG: hypothetical protein HKN92_03805 [Chitinophagales bacterium]|nr:hypothetical protein [Chitinophagales bacterium]